MRPKKRSCPKLFKADKSVTNNLSDNPNQLEQAEADGPKTNQPKRIEEDVSKCDHLDIQLIPENGLLPPAMSVSNKPDQEEAEQCKELSTEVLENISKGVFDFEDNTDGTILLGPSLPQTRRSKVKIQVSRSRG